MSAEAPDVRPVRNGEPAVGGRLRTYREDATAGLAHSHARPGPLRATPVADRMSELLELARMKDGQLQADVARALAEDPSIAVWQAERVVRARYRACSTCGEVLDSRAYLASQSGEIVCCTKCPEHF